VNPQRVQRDERNGTPAPSARPATSLPLDARESASGAPAPSRKPVLTMNEQELIQLARSAGALEIPDDDLGSELIFEIGQLQAFADAVGTGQKTGQLLRDLRDGFRRLDPAWCALNDKPQISDEELDELIGQIEEAVPEVRL
jgi:hypothetical protein